MNRHARTTLNSILALPVMWGWGCTLHESPTLSVFGVTQARQTESGTVWAIELDAENSSDAALPLREVTYELRIDGRTVFAGSRSPEATLRRFGTQRLIVPAVAPAGGTWSADSKYEVTGSLHYSAPGEIAEILFDTGVQNPSVSFSGAGKVSPAK
jgi:hypothetical protein